MATLTIRLVLAGQTTHRYVAILAVRSVEQKVARETVETDGGSEGGVAVIDLVVDGAGAGVVVTVGHEAGHHAQHSPLRVKIFHSPVSFVLYGVPHICKKVSRGVEQNRPLQGT